jgi:hypothetical protein
MIPTLNIKTKHLLLAIVGLLFLCFYGGLFLSERLYPFRMVVFTIVLFLMGLYGIHRFIGKRKIGMGERRRKKYAGHIGLGALLMIIFFVGIQIRQFAYYYIIGIVGAVLFLPAIRDVIKNN